MSDVPKLIHSMIRVSDEARSIEFYRKAFELGIADRLEFETFILIYLSNAASGFELELTINKGHEGPYDLGDGYGHLAVSVDNLEAAHHRMAEAGLAPKDIKSLSHTGGTARFFFIEDPDGYKIEVLQRGWRFA